MVKKTQQVVEQNIDTSQHQMQMQYQDDDMTRDQAYEQQMQMEQDSMMRDE